MIETRAVLPSSPNFATIPRLDAVQVSDMRSKVIDWLKYIIHKSFKSAVESYVAYEAASIFCDHFEKHIYKDKLQKERLNTKNFIGAMAKKPLLKNKEEEISELFTKLFPIW